MPQVTLIVFRGTGFGPLHSHLPALIQAGHAAVYLETDLVIYGYHPTPSACAPFRDDNAILEWLKEHLPMDGSVYNDRPTFDLAFELAQQGEQTTVWILGIDVDDATLEHVRTTLLQWYNEGEIGIYGFPRVDDFPSENCITFLRRLNIDLPDQTGSVRRLIEQMIERGAQRWIPGDEQ